MAWSLLATCVLAVVVGLAIANVRLYHRPHPNDIRSQLGFVRHALDDGKAQDMQRLFPEGYFFTYVLYGLTWIDVAHARPDWAEEALAEARWALAHVDSARGRETFARELTPSFGVFYTGWTAYLYGRILSLGSSRSGDLIPRFQELTREIDQALEASEHPFLESYRDGVWPCDTVVGAAALALHDQVLEPEFQATLETWMKRVDAWRDERGLLPHFVDLKNGNGAEGARATSSTVIARFLADVDPDYARRYYESVRRTFVKPRLGFVGVAEFPDGGGEGDVDSGPLILGISASASVVMAGAAKRFRDDALGDELFGTMEVAGVPIAWGAGKRYGFGLLPVGDAFVAWAAATPPLPVQLTHDFGAAPAKVARGLLHVISVALVLALFVLLTRRRRRHIRAASRSRGVGS